MTGDQTTQAAVDLADRAGRGHDAAAARPGSGLERAAAGAPQSLLRYAPAFVALLAVLADAVQYADTDLWGHVRFGQIMLATRHLIRRDIFSYSAPGAPWTNHEWLAEVVMASFYNALGVVGLKLMKFLCAGAIVVLLAAAVGETEATPTLQFAVLIAAAAGLQLQVQFRPQLFDYIFLAALLALLGRWRRRGRAPLWLVLPMMVLWANLHGGFFIGVVALGIYAGALGAHDLWEGKGLERALRLGALTICAALVTLINPYGVGEWQIVAYNFRSLLTMHYNPEFQNLFYTLRAVYHEGGPLYPFMVPLAIMIALPVSLALAPDLDDLSELAVAAAMTVLAFYAIRNMAFAVIACASPIAGHVSRALARRGHARGGSTHELGPAAASAGGAAPHASGLAQGVAATAAVVLAINGGLFSNRLRDYVPYPNGAIGFMQTHAFSGNVLCDYKWATCLLWHEQSRSRVFIDSFELRYPERIQRDYLDFLRGGAGAARVLAAYPHDFVMVGSDTPPCRFMMKQAGWRLLYRDPVAALFARADSSAARLAVAPVMRDKAPPSMFP